MRFVIGGFVTLAAIVAAMPAHAGDCGCAAAHDGCCDPCGGCDDGCCGDGKRCELKIGKKKIKVICYGCECDAVCLPCPSTPGCEHCEDVCDGCCDSGCCDSCDSHCNKKPICKVRWRDWCPDGAEIYHRKKLVKYEVEKEVPDYKWVVVDCCACGHGADAAAPVGGGDVPPAPPVPRPTSNVTKRAPKGSKLGQTFPLSKEELQKYSSTSVQTVSHVAPKILATSTTKASKDQLPWSLFTK